MQKIDVIIQSLLLFTDWPGRNPTRGESPNGAVKGDESRVELHTKGNGELIGGACRPTPNFSGYEMEHRQIPFFLHLIQHHKVTLISYFRLTRIPIVPKESVIEFQLLGQKAFRKAVCSHCAIIRFRTTATVLHLITKHPIAASLES